MPGSYMAVSADRLEQSIFFVQNVRLPSDTISHTPIAREPISSKQEYRKNATLHKFKWQHKTKFNIIPRTVMGPSHQVSHTITIMLLILASHIHQNGYALPVTHNDTITAHQCNTPMLNPRQRKYPCTSAFSPPAYLPKRESRHTPFQRGLTR